MTRPRCSSGRGTGRGPTARRGQTSPPRARSRTAPRARRRIRSLGGGRTSQEGCWELGDLGTWGLGNSIPARALSPLVPSPKSPRAYARAAVFAAFLADLTAIVAAPFAWLTSVANAAGLDTASSERLFRSSVTPAFFRPLINCP